MKSGNEEELPLYKKIQRVSELLTKGIRWRMVQNSKMKSCDGKMYIIDMGGTLHRLDVRKGKKTKRTCGWKEVV
jgi:hypothetical protein